MAYEVIKTVRGRPYRYRVESYRDPATGKARGKWTYLGPASAGAAARKPTVAREDRAAATRERLLGALERLAGREEWSKLTATAIAEEAGVAHGTFYVHFKNKDEALRAAAARVREAVGSPAVVFAQSLPTLAAERQRLRAWLEGILVQPAAMAGVLRALYTIAAHDPDVQTERSAKYALLRSELASYFARLREAGRTIGEPRGMATLIINTIETSLRRFATDEIALDAHERDGLLDAIERAIFSS